MQTDSVIDEHISCWHYILSDYGDERELAINVRERGEILGIMKYRRELQTKCVGVTPQGKFKSLCDEGVREKIQAALVGMFLEPIDVNCFMDRLSVDSCSVEKLYKIQERDRHIRYATAILKMRFMR